MEMGGSEKKEEKRKKESIFLFSTSIPIFSPAISFAFFHPANGGCPFICDELGANFFTRLVGITVYVRKLVHFVCHCVGDERKGMRE